MNDRNHKSGELIAILGLFGVSYFALGSYVFTRPTEPTFLGTTQTPFSQETVKAILSLVIGLIPLFYDRFPAIKRFVDFFRDNLPDEQPKKEDRIGKLEESIKDLIDEILPLKEELVQARKPKIEVEP